MVGGPSSAGGSQTELVTFFSLVGISVPIVFKFRKQTSTKQLLLAAPAATIQATQKNTAHGSQHQDANKATDLLKAVAARGAKLDIISECCEKHPWGQTPMDVAWQPGNDSTKMCLRERGVGRQYSHDNPGSRNRRKPNHGSSEDQVTGAITKTPAKRKYKDGDNAGTPEKGVVNAIASTLTIDGASLKTSFEQQRNRGMNL